MIIVSCLVGAAVLLSLPSGTSPTLRQAIVAAHIPTANARIENLDKPITGWSWECDGDNYAVGYFLDQSPASPSDPSRFWIARYDADRKEWRQISQVAKSAASTNAESNEVHALFYDGYYLYVELKGATGDFATLQFARDLSLVRQFPGSTVAPLPHWRLLLRVDSPSSMFDVHPSLLVFDPDSGTSTKIYPLAIQPPLDELNSKELSREFAACGSDWLSSHEISKDPNTALRLIVGVKSDLVNDAVAAAIGFGNPALLCKESNPVEHIAIYVYLHPGDAKHIQFREIAVPEKHMPSYAELRALLTTESLAKLFGKSISSGGGR